MELNSPAPAVLYDGARFMVVASSYAQPVDLFGLQFDAVVKVYEILDRINSVALCLTGQMADGFVAQIRMWQLAAPHEEEVITVLDSYIQIANCPLTFQ